MLPTFIVVGAPKSGTTTLYEYLKDHPEVCLSSFRDPDFFCTETGVVDGGPSDGLAFSGNYHKGLAWYKGLFQPCVSARAIGEVSRAYLTTPNAPALIDRAIPGVRLIFSLRDPVNRLYSHYWQERKVGWDLPAFEQMARTNHPRYRHYLDTSSYHLHLERYLAVFPRSQISVVLFEDLARSPGEYARDLYQLVGVDPDFIPPNLGARRNPASLPRSPRLQRLLINMAALRWKMAGQWRLYGWLSKAGRALLSLNSVLSPYPPLPPRLRAELVAELEPAIAYTEAYLGRSLPEWRMV